MLIVIIADYITGIAKSYKKSTLSSKTGKLGIIKKFCLLVLVALTTVIDNITVGTGVLRTFMVYYLIANEGLSILENLSELDIVVPEFLKKHLEKIKDTNNIGVEKKNG